MATPTPLDVLKAKVKRDIRGEAEAGVKPWVYLAVGIALLALLRSSGR